jgi:sugar lactone lactonase YvrE
MKHLFFTISIIGLFAFVGKAQTADLKTDRIETLLGPEDFVLDNYNANERLLISCSARRKTEAKAGGIIAYDIKSGKTYPLVRIGEPVGFQFFPHGIDLVRDYEGKLMLYVVNHQPDGKRNINSVAQYELKGDTLFFIKNYISKLIVSPNDVTGLPDGTFYVTNDSKHTKGVGLLFEKLFQTRRSTIVYKNAKDEFLVATKRLAYANGIANREDKVWIACTFKKDLIEYSRNADGTLTKQRSLPGIKGMDNISLYGNSLVIASHADFKKFLKHVKASESKSPGVVSVINLADNTIQHIYTTDGKEISANSVAMIHNDTLYIGQVFDGFVLKVKGYELK